MALTQAMILWVFALAGVLHGLTGIGVTLIATTVLVTIYPLPHALILAVMSFIGSVIGEKLLFIIPANVLLIAMGVVIVLYVLSQSTGKTIHIQPNRTNTLLFRLIAGVVGGATNVMSSVIMRSLLSALPSDNNAKTELVKASNLCYLVNKFAFLKQCF